VPGDASIDGEVVVSANVYYTVPGTSEIVERPAIVLHELIENVERTGNGKSYDDAHASASAQARVLPTTDHRYSKDPGRASPNKKVKNQ
jgi:hypothetical protein